MVDVAALFLGESLCGLTSDEVLARVRPALEEQGWEMERGKRKADKVVRDGWELDGWHPEHRAILEVVRTISVAKTARMEKPAFAALALALP